MVHHPVNQLQNELTQAAPTPAPAPELEPAQAQGGHTSLWHSEKMVGTQIELLLLLYVVIGAIQVVGSRYRRTINSAYVKYPLWMAYSASQPLVAYTLAVMYNSPFKETQSLLTTLFVVVALGRVNTMTAYKVDDNKRYAAHFFRHVLFVVSFMSMVITIPHVSGFKGWYILIMYPIVVFLLIFFLTMNGGRACANIMASSFSDKGSLYLQTHMKTEHLVELPYDPVSLKGYNYLVLSFDEEKKEHRKDKRERIVEVKENDDDDKEEDVELDEKNGEEEKDLEKDDESDQEKEEIVEVKEKDDDNDNDHDDEEEEEQMKEMDDDYDEGEEKSDDEDEPYHITVSMVWRSLSELLPDHPLETTRLFHEVRNQALNLLRKDRTPSEKYKKMRIYNRQHETTFAAGIQLGKKLEKMGDDSSRWKILADLWTEMILYVAPSDNAKDHIQHLANGGEFITHLWALLSHAGILERDQQIHGHPPAECSASREPTTYADEQTCRNDHQLDPSVQATKLQQTEVEMTTPMECRIDISEVSSSTKQP
ncbi:hypothetical protein ZWY2020_058762 [Hordeum vulgare]|nr:hypothetical protein ZWY2020_058762 [Hordeum vulgare]